jgi:hypothetical protein
MAHTANPGWITIVVFAVGHNVVHAGRGDEMLSEACDRYLVRHPVLTHLAVGIVALHLLNRLPVWLDPLSVFMGALSRKIGPLR